jgi:hypothetical protein
MKLLFIVVAMIPAVQSEHSPAEEIALQMDRGSAH